MFLLTVSAQVVESTACAGYVLDKLKPYGLDKRASGIYPMKNLMDDKLMEVRTINSAVIFVGIRLFPRKEGKERNELYFDFAERYWLELLLCKDNFEALSKLKDDKVALFVDGNIFNLSSPSVKSLLSSAPTDEILFGNSDSLYYVGWKNVAGQEIALQFRKRIDLILGMDKRELEYFFFTHLNTYRVPAKAKAESPNSSTLGPSAMPNIFVRKGATYLIPEMMSDQYWRKNKDGSMSLLFDEDYIPESITNLFTGDGNIDTDVKVRVNQRYYTSETQKYECDLSKFCSFMHDEKNIVYVGIDALKDDRVTGVVIYENKDYRYNHGLYFSAPYTVFKDRKGYIDATLYTYIPTHNVQTIYGTDDNKPKKNLIEILK